jgi:hypothetical protein
MTGKPPLRLTVLSGLLLAAILPAAQSPGRVPALFLTADRCISCHNGIVTSRGEDVSFGANWRPSMMANSSRDPYWQAGVRRETLVHPSARAAIEDECSACHMPLARFEAKSAGRPGRVFANLPVSRAVSPESLKAADGVSCTLCHQVRPDNFGQRSSFVAGFAIDAKTPIGRRPVYGPYAVDEGRQALMRSSARFVPTEGAHVRESELCATCHTLLTEALDREGKVIGRLPEQVPYLEWKHSSYAGGRSCQDCHMPVVDGRVPLTGVLGRPRADVGRHVFLAGNFLVPKMLSVFRFDLGTGALPEELEAASLRTVEHLRSAAAELSFDSVELKSGRLEARVRVRNLAGHKLPTAYPSRRAWIHFVVRDGNDSIVFESGRLKADGSIEGNANDGDAGLYEPHHARIDRPGRVQVYETVMAGPDDKVTTVLLTAVRYLKDNRLLPDGFLKTTADDDIAVRGGAAEDGDFEGGGDRVLYAVDPGAAPGPFRVQAELWYQPIGYRWAHNLEREETAEGKRFVSFYESLAGESAVVLARASATVKTP